MEATNQNTPATISLETIGQKLDELIGQASQPAKRFLSINDAAAYTGLSPESVRRLISARKLTPRRPVRGKIVLDRNEIDAYVLGSTASVKRGRGQTRGA